MIVIEDVNGLIYYINPGETHMTPSGNIITYEQVVEWMYSGTLRQHGFCAPTVNNKFGHSNNNRYAVIHAINLACIAAT